MNLIKWSLSGLLFLLISTMAIAQEEIYYGPIPSALLRNADAVIRYDSMDVQINALDDILVTKIYAVTILNDKGNPYGIIDETYGNGREIVSIKGQLLDKDGNKIRRLKNKDIKDVTVYDGVEFYNDLRKKQFDFGYGNYPYTCEYEIKTKLKWSIYLPEWNPQPGYNCAVEKSGFNIQYPKGLKLRYKTVNLDHCNITEQTTPDGKRIAASIVEKPAMEKPDDFTYRGNNMLPSLEVVPDKFIMDNRPGSLDTWQSLGKFMYDLNANRDSLPAATKKIVHQLTDTCKTAYEKISVLYHYMQKTTHYVAIMLGIGGWQTFEASFVAEKGYGDCKALSNYMEAMLKEAGISSNKVLINAANGNMPYYHIQKDFPINMFDHMILCVPQRNDTTWLECTAKTLPAGFLSSFTEDRDALLLAPDGGHIVHTPKYGIENNKCIRRAVFSVNENNDIEGNLSLQYTGDMDDMEIYHIKDQEKKDVDEYMNSKLTLPNYNVTSYSFTEQVNKYIPSVKEQLAIKGSANISQTGSRLFIQPQVLSLNIMAPSSYEERTVPFEIKESYQYLDTVEINLPGNYTSEFIPDDIKMNYDFGGYSNSIVFNGNKIRVIRHYYQYAGLYPAADFKNYIALSKAVNYKAEEDKVVLEKK